MVFFKNNPPKSELTTVLDALKQGDIFVDIGANCGLFTVLGAMKVGDEGRVLAVEPNSIMLDRLKYNIGINELSNVEICESAIGPKAGEAELHIDRRQYGKSSIVSNKKLEKVKVKLDTLDSILESRGLSKIDLMKIDIEGYEYPALHPFFETAQKSKWPLKILIETAHTNKSETNPVNYLIEKGYSIVWSSKNDALLGLR
ncbi:MAG: FkbM family methyltransferase [Hyphomicrobiales bacterium]|nr:FkbM family methyltransferase [Hyphomicrobiales bacterium]